MNPVHARHAARPGQSRAPGRAAARTTVALAAAALLAGGCGGRTIDLSARRHAVVAGSAPDLDARADAIRADPIGYMQRVAERCAELSQYTLLFTRIERRGLLFRTLCGPERIRCWFRRRPFSIRMKWLDDDIKYGESTYVAGQDGDRVRFVPRHGLFGLPPVVTRVDLQTPVIWGEARRPLSEWGLENLMLETLESIDSVRPQGGVRIEYRGVVTLPRSGDRAAHYLYLYYPRHPSEACVQELYFDAESDLPAATILRFADGTLDAAYFYDELNTDVVLRDEDFLLEAERPRPVAGAPRPASAGLTAEASSR